jgi:nitrogen fixation NifU-like protein
MAIKNFDFFQDHSLPYLEMALRSDRRALIKKPDGYGKRTGDCGDTVEFYLQVRQETIQYLSFLTNGCINTTACCNAVAHLVEGRSVEEAWDITPEDVIAYLETLPADHVHCAELSVGAFYLALSNYQELNRAPWKKMYHGYDIF